jgi:hypothetical protein
VVRVGQVVVALAPRAGIKLAGHRAAPSWALLPRRVFACSRAFAFAHLLFDALDVRGGHSWCTCALSRCLFL